MLKSRKVFGTLLFSVVLVVVVWTLCATATSAATFNSPEQREQFLLGGKLWPVYCAQCHNARPGSQFSPAQWDAITMHMHTQSIMPAKDLRAIKEFLKTAR